jgi:hypothetical protein
VVTIIRHDCILRAKIQHQENKRWRHPFRQILADRAAFDIIGQRFTTFALKIVALEWEAIKALEEAVSEGIEEIPTPGCLFSYPLSLRYGLFCKH